jgi:hypothetical protein
MDMERGAVISECGKYRYYLSRRWAEGGKTMVFIMLNPSIADADIDDATIRKCIGFAQRNGCNAIEVVNLYGFRATDPADLASAGFPCGLENWAHIKSAIVNPDAVIVCAWGANGNTDQASEVLGLLRHKRRKIYCLSKTKSGMPGHPLMLPYTSPLQPY